MELMLLTDSKTGEPIFVDPQKILLIQQLIEENENPRRTRIDVEGSSQIFIVKESSEQVALASGRGFYTPEENVHP